VLPPPYHPALLNLPRCWSPVAQTIPLTPLWQPPSLAPMSSPPLKPKTPAPPPPNLRSRACSAASTAASPRCRRLCGAASLLHRLHLLCRRGRHRRETPTGNPCLPVRYTLIGSAHTHPGVCCATYAPPWVEYRYHRSLREGFCPTRVAPPDGPVHVRFFYFTSFCFLLSSLYLFSFSKI
jgi:hypothetical protein